MKLVKYPGGRYPVAQELRSDRLISVGRRHVCVTPLVSSRSACRRHATRIRGSGETGSMRASRSILDVFHVFNKRSDRLVVELYKILFVYSSVDLSILSPPSFRSLIDQLERKERKRKRPSSSIFPTRLLGEVISTFD